MDSAYLQAKSLTAATFHSQQCQSTRSNSTGHTLITPRSTIPHSSECNSVVILQETFLDLFCSAKWSTLTLQDTLCLKSSNYIVLFTFCLSVPSSMTIISLKVEETLFIVISWSLVQYLEHRKFSVNICWIKEYINKCGHWMVSISVSFKKKWPSISI